MTDLKYLVTQDSSTERALDHLFWNSDEAGIYVVITTGEPLFLSSDIFDSGWVWPSFCIRMRK
ncbi:peptide-methionine (R)-S-oxide reductase [Streptococcus suis]